MATMHAEHNRHQSQESKPASRSYPFWRQHKRSHTTANTHPHPHPPHHTQPSISITPTPPKRLHERPPLNLELMRMEEVPIVFMSPIRERPAFPLSIQTRPTVPTRSAPCTPWPLTPNSPFLDKALPNLPLVATTSPRSPIGPAPNIPLPPTPRSPARGTRQAEVPPLDPKSSVRSIKRPKIQPLKHTRSISAPFLDAPAPLEPPPKSPLRSTTPLSQMAAIPEPELPLLLARKGLSLSRNLKTEHLPPPLKSPARVPLFPEALLSPRLPRSAGRFPRQQQEVARPPTPSSTAPAVMTSLLQEVLAIMDGIMSSQQAIQSEDRILHELTELVVIMQQEAEDLLNLADLVEEYVEEIHVAEQVADIEDWVDDLDLGYYGEEETISEPVSAPAEEEKQKGHSRDDSAVSLGAEDAFHAGELRESIYREVPIVRRHTPDNREVKEIQIRGETVVVRPAVVPQEPQNLPHISEPRPRKLRPKKSLSLFRDSGLGLLTPNGSVRSRIGPKSPKSPRWI